MLVDLLAVSGGEGAELLRRWVAALMSAPAGERLAIVEAIERRITELYESDVTADLETLVHIESDASAGDGFTETVVKSFAKGKPRTKAPLPSKRTG